MKGRQAARRLCLQESNRANCECPLYCLPGAEEKEYKTGHNEKKEFEAYLDKYH